MRYTFGDQAGAIPGIPGTFAHCSVEVDEDGTVRVLPAVPGQNIIYTGSIPVDVQVQEAPAQEETIVQEQSADAPAPQVGMGG